MISLRLVDDKGNVQGKIELSGPIDRDGDKWSSFENEILQERMFQVISHCSFMFGRSEQAITRKIIDNLGEKVRRRK